MAAAPAPEATINVCTRVMGEGAKWSTEVLTKTLAFRPAMTVADALSMIAEKTNTPNNNRGLYKPPGVGTLGEWLVPTKTLWHYKLKADDELHYKCKSRPLSLQLLGDRTKTVFVDDSWTVDEILLFIAKDIQLNNPEEYGLKPVGKEADNTAWLTRARTLEANGVLAGEQLLFMKKLFFFDKWIDVKDNTALNMLYAQMRDEVLSGRIELEDQADAVTYASIIYHVNCFAYDEDKGQVRIDNLADYLPEKYRHVKKIEEQIYKQHRTYFGPIRKQYNKEGVSKDQADDDFQKARASFQLGMKQKFCQTLRTKKLYGFVYFPVELKVRHKRALRKSLEYTAEPRILGLGRDYIMLFKPEDMKKGVMEHHYQEVHQWQSTGNKLTIDFAEYEDAVVTVLTPNAEPISEYIRQYIDLHSRRFVRPEARAVEKPKAAAASDNPSTAPPVAGGAKGGLGEVSKAIDELGFHSHEVKEGPKLNASTPEEQLAATTAVKDDIVGNMGKCADAVMQMMLCAMGDVGLLNPDLLLQAAMALDEAMKKLIGNVEKAAGISDDDQDDVLGDMQKLIKVASQMAKAAQTASLGAVTGDLDAIALADLLAAARDVGEALKNLLGSTMVIGTNNEIPDLPLPLLDLLAAAKSLSDALKNLTDEAQSHMFPEIAKLKNALLEAQKLESLLSVKATSLDSPEGEKLGARIDALKLTLAELQGQIEAMPGIDDALLEASQLLSEKIRDLIGAYASATKPADRSKEIEGSSERVADGVRSLVAMIQEGKIKKPKLLAAMKNVVNDTANLGRLADLEAQSMTDTELQKSLLAAAQALSQAMTQLISSGDALSKATDSKERADATINAATNLADYARALMMDRKRIAAMKNLVSDAKKLGQAINKVLEEAEREVDEVRHPLRKAELQKAITEGKETEKTLMGSLQIFSAAPNEPKYQSSMISTSAAATKKANTLGQAVEGAAQHSDNAKYLLEAQGNLVQAADDLKFSLKGAREACWQLDIEDSSGVIKHHIEGAEAALKDWQQGKLQNAKKVTQQQAQDETFQDCKTLETVAREVSDSVLTGQPAMLASAVKQLAAQSEDLLNAAEGVAVTTANREAQEATLVNCKEALQKVLALVKAGKNGMLHPNDVEMKKKIAAARTSVVEALAALKGHLPGQGDCEKAIETIRVAAEHLAIENLPPADEAETYEQHTDQITTSGRATAAGMLTLHPAANASPDELGQAAKKVSDLAFELIHQAERTAAKTPIQAAKTMIIGTTKTAAEKLNAVLQLAKEVGANSENEEAPKELTKASQECSDALSSLLTAVRSGRQSVDDINGQACDKAVEEIGEAKSKLALGELTASNPEELREKQDAVLDSAKDMTENASKLVLTAKSDPAKVGEAATVMSKNCTQLAAAVLAAAGALPSAAGGGDGAGINTAEFKTGIKKCLDAIGQMLKADKEGKEAKLMLKTVATVGKAVMDLSNLCKERAKKAPSEEVKTQMKETGDELQETATKLIKAAAAHVKNPEDEKLKDKFMSKSKAVALKCTGLSNLVAQLPEQAGGALGMHQQGLLDNAKAFCDAASHLVGASKLAAAAPEDAGSQTLLAAASQPVQDTLAALVEATKYAGPGQAECEHTMKAVTAQVTELNAALMALSVGDFMLRMDPMHDLFVNGLLAAARDLADALKDLIGAAGTSPKALGEAADKIDSLVTTMAEAATNSAKTTTDTPAATQLMRFAKDVAEEMAIVLKACRDAGGNAAEAAALQEAQQAAALTQDTIAGLRSFLGTLAAKGHDCDIANKVIDDAKRQINTSAPLQAGYSFKDYEKDLKAAAKDLVSSTAQIVHASQSAPDMLGDHCKSAANSIPPLFAAVCGEMQLTNDDNLNAALLAAAMDLADACKGLVDSAKQVQISPEDGDAKKTVRDASDKVTDAMTRVLKESKAASAQQTEVEDAKRTIEESVVEVNTSNYLANNGQLYTPSTKLFPEHEEAVDNLCKEVAHHVSNMLEASAKTAEELGNAAKAAAASVQSLVMTGIAAASAVEETPNQLELLEKSKAIGEAFIELISAAQRASEKGPGKGEKRVKGAAKAVALAIAELINVTKKASEVATVGLKGLKNASNKVKKSAKALTEPGTATPAAVAPEQVVNAAKDVNTGASKLYFAARKPQSVIADRANDVGNSTCALMDACAGAAATTAEPVKAKFLDAATNVAKAVIAQLKVMQQPMAEQESGLLNSAQKHVGQSVAALLSSVYSLTHGEENLDQQAERELMAAAAAIEEAAARLRAARQKKASDGHQVTQYEQKLTDACDQISAAAVSLLRASVDAQKEIVAQGKEHEGAKYNPDPKWADGLISAAREVVAATEQLMSYALAFVAGEAEDVYLIAASSVVTSSTQHLLLAAKVKATNLGSAGQVAVDNASKAVGAANKLLLASAQEGLQDEYEEEGKQLSVREKMMQKDKLSRMEKELDALRKNLNKKK